MCECGRGALWVDSMACRQVRSIMDSVDVHHKDGINWHEFLAAAVARRHYLTPTRLMNTFTWISRGDPVWVSVHALSHVRVVPCRAVSCRVVPVCLRGSVHRRTSLVGMCVRALSW